MDETNLTANSSSLQNRTDFTPTPLMLKWLLTGFEVRSSSPTVIAKKFKGRRSTWYDWQKIPDFIRWWNEEWEKFYTSQSFRLIEIGLKKAETDHEWWRDMMDYFKLREQKQELTQNVNQINIMASAFEKGSKERGLQKTGKSF